MNRKKITAVITALNEEATVSDVITGLKRYVDEIILIDDASTDKTAAIAEKYSAVVVSNPKRMGYDSNLDTGFALARKRGAGIVFTFDADGEHNPDDIPTLIKPIQDGEADIVVGRRPRYPRISECLFAIFARIKIGIDDPICGFKAYDMRVYNDIGYFDRLSSIGSQLMFNAKKKGYRIIQRDITINKRIDTPRFGRSLRANYKIFKAMANIIFHYI
jgi:glycosyltransferase involved in cell wall biosynthesis